jgi:U3 small nucleolar RNA-associated protein 25
VFYAPPDHGDYYPEILNLPFETPSPSGLPVDPAEVTSEILFSRYDFLRLQRIVGNKDAQRLVTSQEGERFTFA